MSKFNFFSNDVNPNNQVKFPYYFEGSSEAFYKVMFIGNSITYHEKSPSIGWNKDCGMAASSIKNDYVHLVLNFLNKKYGDVCACILNGSSWESDNTNDGKFLTIKKALQDFKPDMVIIRIGENFSKENLANNIDPTPSFEKLINASKENSNNVVITSLFWKVKILDDAIIKASEKYQIPYIKINDLGDDDSNKAIGQYQHKGICGHPSDLGMKKIAERIINQIDK